MKISQRKDMDILLTIFIVVSFSCFALMILEAFAPFDSPMPHIGYFVEGLIVLSQGILAIYLKRNLFKKAIHKLAFKLFIIEIILFPIVLFFNLAFSVSISDSYGMWLYYFSLSIIVLSTFFCYFAAFYISKKVLIDKKDEGYVIIKNLFFISGTIYFIVLLFYALTPLKFDILFDFINSIKNEEGEAIIPSSYLIILIIQALFSLVILLQGLYFIFSTLITSKEDEMVDLRHNFKYTIRLIKKYDLPFWFGIVVTSFLFVLAFVSTLTLFSKYFSLCALYAMVLLARFPLHFKEKKYDQIYKNNLKLQYKKKYYLMLYVAILMFIYVAITLVFGTAINAKADGTQSIIITVSVFVPFAIFKMVMSIINYRKVKRSGDPILRSGNYLDILMMIFTLSSALLLLINNFEEQWMMFLLLGIAALLDVYPIIISIYLFIISIKGIRGKRNKDYDKYEKYMVEKYKIEEEHKKEEKLHKKKRQLLLNSK